MNTWHPAAHLFGMNMYITAIGRGSFLFQDICPLTSRQISDYAKMRLNSTCFDYLAYLDICKPKSKKRILCFFLFLWAFLFIFKHFISHAICMMLILSILYVPEGYSISQPINYSFFCSIPKHLTLCYIFLCCISHYKTRNLTYKVLRTGEVIFHFISREKKSIEKY